MNPFDAHIMSWLNGFAQRWPVLDKAAVFTTSGMIAKGTFVALFLWWPWSERSERLRRNREIIWATVLAAFGSLIVGLVVQKLLPFRMRPIDNPALHFVHPRGQGAIEGWPSSFPSDHAILFATLATGSWFIAPEVGIAAHVFAFTMIGLPRIYVGLHYPTDILAGTMLGTLGAVIANRDRVRTALAAIPMRWTDRYPGFASAILFLLAVQIASVFWEPRFIVSSVLRLMGLHVGFLH
jgi:undecaprenyl-diphosphatase